MKFLGISGSLRKASYNTSLLKYLIANMDAGDQMTLADLSNFPLYNQDLKAPEAVQILAEQIKACDAIIFACPEYNYSITGVLKNALDWVSRHPDKPTTGKSAAIIGASPGKIGTARAQYHLRQIGVFLDLRFLNKPEVMVGEAIGKFDSDHKLIDLATQDHLGKMLAALKEFI